VAASLNTADCFVLNDNTVGRQFIWIGKHASADERQTAFSAAINTARGKLFAQIEITEGSETDEFWAALGGKGKCVLTFFLLILMFDGIKFYRRVYF
jgi:hypothetical protein